MWRQRPDGLAEEGSERRAREAGVARKTIRQGRGELEAGVLYRPGERIRKQGGGRKTSTAKDATLRADLEEMLEPKGDPESLVRWTSKSVSKLLHEMGFSLKTNKKSREGASHADRDAQFQHINRTGKVFEAKGKPVISVDCKKKELIGNAQERRERMASQRPRHGVNVSDYLSMADGKAIAYGIYDLCRIAASSTSVSTMR